MRNKFAGNCRDCGNRVETGEGYFQRADGGPRRWIVRCMTCVTTSKAARGDALSHAQSEHMAKLRRAQA